MGFKRERLKRVKIGTSGVGEFSRVRVFELFTECIAWLLQFGILIFLFGGFRNHNSKM